MRRELEKKWHALELQICVYLFYLQAAQRYRYDAQDHRKDPFQNTDWRNVESRTASENNRQMDSSLWNSDVRVSMKLVDSKSYVRTN